ncbi:MAG TPA: tetratricopeptide repeat protein, partial [Gammaproteobacteria bacterium]|nr:tetratricopeptide repeat protein [Gammaproteobacteria bacterium]
DPPRANANLARARLLLVAGPEVTARPAAKAQRQLRRALAKDPRALEARMALARLLVGQGRKGQALKVLDAGLKWPYPGPQPVAFFLYTAERHRAAGDAETARDLARRALRRLDPSGKAAAGIRRHFGLQTGSDGDAAS